MLPSNDSTNPTNTDLWECCRCGMFTDEPVFEPADFVWLPNDKEGRRVWCTTRCHDLAAEEYWTARYDKCRS